MASKKLLFLFVLILFISNAFGQMAEEVLQLNSKNDLYKEQNVFLAKPNLEVVQIVSYNGSAIDDEYELQLFLRVLKIDSLIEGEVYNVVNDTGIIKCSFDIQSVWNWEPEKTNISGTVAMIKLSRNKITLAFNLIVTELRNSRTYSYTGRRTFLKSRKSRPRHWNSY